MSCRMKRRKPSREAVCRCSGQRFPSERSQLREAMPMRYARAFLGDARETQIVAQPTDQACRRPFVDGGKSATKSGATRQPKVITMETECPVGEARSSSQAFSSSPGSALRAARGQAPLATRSPGVKKRSRTTPTGFSTPAFARAGSAPFPSSRPACRRLARPVNGHTSAESGG
jgi:hypothetical protein